MTTTPLDRPELWWIPIITMIGPHFARPDWLCVSSQSWIKARDFFGPGSDPRLAPDWIKILGHKPRR